MRVGPAVEDERRVGGSAARARVGVAQTRQVFGQDADGLGHGRRGRQEGHRGARDAHEEVGLVFKGRDAVLGFGVARVIAVESGIFAEEVLEAQLAIVVAQVERAVGGRCLGLELQTEDERVGLDLGPYLVRVELVHFQHAAVLGQPEPRRAYHEYPIHPPYMPRSDAPLILP